MHRKIDDSTHVEVENTSKGLVYIVSTIDRKAGTVTNKTIAEKDLKKGPHTIEKP